jgi:hypothetical protein
MDDFLDGFSQTRLGTLRRSVQAAEAQNNAEIVPGIYLSWDEEGTGLSVGYDSPDWAMLSLDTKMTAPPRWFSLNLALAEGRIAADDVLGLVVEGYAAQGATLTLRLRSAIGGEVFDSDWEDVITLHPENNVSVALRRFSALDGIVDAEGYHTLILGLPSESATLTIRNMRLFRMPGSRELRPEPETLSSFAV